jgi:hypothetical protein
MLTLAITGFETDPDRVTEILQITPTTIGRVGDIGRSGRPAAFNGWWLEAHEERLTDGRQHSAALATIVGRLQGKEESFAGFCQTKVDMSLAGRSSPKPMWL